MTNARKLIKDSKIAEFHLVYFKTKNKLSLEFFSSHKDIIKKNIDLPYLCHLRRT